MAFDPARENQDSSRIMDLSVTCECGSRLAVSPSMAGQVAVCTCGKSVQVPRLSELRRAVGLDAFEVSISDRLHAMSRDGRLPVERECVACGKPTQERLECSVECERPYAKGPSFWKSFFVMLLGPIWAMAAMKRDYDATEVHGNELVIRTPIRICRSCFESGSFSKRRCVELLRKTGHYARLLDAYPKADVHWKAHETEPPGGAKANGSQPIRSG